MWYLEAMPIAALEAQQDLHKLVFTNVLHGEGWLNCYAVTRSTINVILGH